MDRLVYTALSGLRSNMSAQDITAHNIANASTPGFKRDIGSAERRDLSSPSSFASRIQSAEGVLASEMAAGPISATGRALDVAMRGKAMLAVQDGDGKEAYTRRGDLRVGATGVLETGDGYAVAGTGGPITVPPATRMEIGEDGTVSIQPQGSDAKDLTAIGQIKLVTPEDDKIAKGLDGLMRAKDRKDLPADADARVDAGSLEGSNVNMMESMVEMIEQARAYEVQVQMISSMKDLDQSSTNLLRIDN
jgi:flagellar basal-body rod protein FlgF